MQAKGHSLFEVESTVFLSPNNVLNRVGINASGTALLPPNWGKWLGEPPELRTHDCSRINLAKAAELEASGGAR